MSCQSKTAHPAFLSAVAGSSSSPTDENATPLHEDGSRIISKLAGAVVAAMELATSAEVEMAMNDDLMTAEQRPVLMVPYYAP